MKQSKKYAKRVTSLALATMLILPSFAFAGEISGTTTISNPTGIVKGVSIRLSIDEAVKMVQENNSAIKQAQLDLAAAEVQLKQAESASKQMKDVRDMPTMSIPDPSNPGQTILISSGIKAQEMTRIIEIVPTQAKIALDIAKTAVDLQKDVAEFTVKQQYYALVMAGQQEQLSYNALERARKQLKETQLLESLGMAAKIQVMQADFAVQQAYADLNDKRTKTYEAKMSLAQTLGLAVGTDISPTSTLTFQKYVIEDDEALIAKLFAENKGYVIQNKQYEINKLNYDYDMKIMPENTYDHKIAASNLEKATSQNKDSATKLQMSLLMAVKNLEVGEENFKAMDSAVKLAAESYRLTELRYREGMATLSELQKAEADLREAEFGRLGIIYAYTMTSAQLQYNIF